jgi:hypothetical protein
VPLGILLAAGVRPYLAIALIPRRTNFLAGRMSLWLNMTRNEMFSTNLTVGYLWDAAVANYPYARNNPSRFRSNDNVIHVVSAFQPYVVTSRLQNKVGSDPLDFPTRRLSWSSKDGQWATAKHPIPFSLSQ